MARGKTFYLALVDGRHRSELDRLPLFGYRELERHGGDPLLSLCREEASQFSEFLRLQGTGGLTRFELTAVISYLYQKLRGKLDATQEAQGTDHPPGGEDGTS